jgi:hypothetical protein
MRFRGNRLTRRAFGVAARMKDTGYFSVDACEVSVHVGATARRDHGNKILLRYAEATGSKFHVRLSMAWCCALAPINNASPNSEMALLERFELLYGNVRKKCRIVRKLGISISVVSRLSPLPSVCFDFRPWHRTDMVH